MAFLFSTSYSRRPVPQSVYFRIPVGDEVESFFNLARMPDLITIRIRGKAPTRMQASKGFCIDEVFKKNTPFIEFELDIDPDFLERPLSQNTHIPPVSLPLLVMSLKLKGFHLFPGCRPRLYLSTLLQPATGGPWLDHKARVSRGVGIPELGGKGPLATFPNHRAHTGQSPHG